MYHHACTNGKRTFLSVNCSRCNHANYFVILANCLVCSSNNVVYYIISGGIHVHITLIIIRPFGYERVYLPLCEVVDTPFIKVSK